MLQREWKSLSMLTAVIAVVLCLFLLPTQAEAATIASGTCGDNLTWMLDDAGTLTISGTGAMEDYVISTAPWYNDRASVIKVILNEGITHIGNAAFCYCSSLAHIVIPNSVITIGEAAFEDCSSLTTVTIPENVTGIEKYAFKGCGLTTVTIPNSVTQIGTSAFRSCKFLYTVTIGTGVTDIGDFAFYNCSSLTDVHYFGTTEQKDAISVGINNDPFANAAWHYILASGICGADGDNLTWTLDDAGTLTISGIGAMANFIYNSQPWYSCRTSIKTVLIQEGVTSIGDSSFNSSNNMADASIPSSVTSIGDAAFYSCSSLTNINIPAGVVSIGVSSFEACSSLISVALSESVVIVGSHAFQNCTSLTSVIIPNGVAYIGNYAFNNCGNLKYNIYNNAKYLGNKNNPYIILIESVSDDITACTIHEDTLFVNSDAFSWCQNLKHITIPDGVIRIGFSAFWHCSNLVSIFIPASLTTVDNQVFYYCNNLRHVAYGGNPTQWNKISFGIDNSCLTNASVLHYEVEGEPVYSTKNCVDSGLFCEICGDFITKESAESGSHSYADGNDMRCDDCGYFRTVESFYIYEYPTVREFALFCGVLDVADSVLMVTYSDGTTGKTEMTLDMVSGFDNTMLGTQMLTVTLGSKTTTYTVKIVPGNPISLTVKTLPNTLSYITGGNVNLTGLVLTADYGNNRTAELSASDVTMDAVDMTTMGAKIVTVRKGTALASFTVYVHDKTVETIDSVLYPESSHNYAANTNETKTFTWEGAGSLTLTFSSSSYTESNYDFVYIYDGTGNQIAKYSGNLSGKTVTVPGDTFRIKLTADSSVNKYGYAFSSIVAETVLHPGVEQDAVPPTCTKPGMTAGAVCEICGMTLGGEEIPTIAHEYVDGYCIYCQNVTAGEEHYATLTDAMCANGDYLRLNHDLTEDVIVTASAYLDLNGYTLTGDITIADEVTLYVFDSATADYTAGNRGKIVGTVTGDLAKTLNTPETYGHNYKYLAVEEGAGGVWSFHRYYLTVKSAVLVPYMNGEGYTGTALDYKIVFKCNELVAKKVTVYGALLEGDRTAYCDVTGMIESGAETLNERTVRLAGLIRSTDTVEENAANALLRPTCKAWITLTDGTTITSAGVRRSLQDMIVYANAQTDLSAPQKKALGRMYDLFRDVLDTWTTVDISNIKQYAQL